MNVAWIVTGPKKTRVRTLASSTSSERSAALHRFDMKAKITITPKKAVVDPQGKAVLNALNEMGYTGISAVHVGKYLEIELKDADRETVRARLDEACHRFLSNPVIEDYCLELE